MKRIVLDLDHTICTPLERNDQTSDPSAIYVEATPNIACIERIKDYKKQGFEIVIYTSRNMRTFEGDADQIRKHTLPIILSWLDHNQVPYDQVVIGKLWCGETGFYVDDRAIRPSEFISNQYEEILHMLEDEKMMNKA